MLHWAPRCRPRVRVRAFRGIAGSDDSGAVARTVFEVVNPKDEDPRSWVSDQAQVLSAGEVSRLERDLTRLYEDTGAEIAVVTLQDVEGAETAAAVRRFAKDLFDEWGIGAARLESGLLMLYVGNRRRFEVITGAGVARLMPTAWLDRMLAGAAFPEFYNDACNLRIREAWHAVGRSEKALWLAPDTLHLVAPAPRLFASGGDGAGEGSGEDDGAGGGGDAESPVPGGAVRSLRRWHWMFGTPTGAERAAEARFWEEAAARWGPAPSSGGRGGGGWDWRWGHLGGEEEEYARQRQRRARWAWLVVATAGGVALWRAYRRRWRCRRCGGHLDRVATSQGTQGWVGVTKSSRWREVNALPADAAELVWEETCTSCQRRERELGSAHFDICTCSTCGAHTVLSVAQPGWRRCSKCTCVTEQEAESQWEYRAYACRSCGHERREYKQERRQVDDPPPLRGVGGPTGWGGGTSSGGGASGVSW